MFVRWGKDFVYAITQRIGTIKAAPNRIQKKLAAFETATIYQALDID